MTTDLLDRSLGDLARSIPGATALFHQHQLDFCCGGKQTLRHAMGGAPSGAPGPASPALQQLLADLSRLQDGPASPERDWREASSDELIDHILQRYHERHRAQLPELVRLARRVEAVHADRPECPHGLADHLEAMLQDLSSHMEKEEQVLFPMLRLGFPPMVQGPVTLLRLEHDDHGVALARLVELAHGLDMPRGACNTWRALINGLQTLRTDLMQHIHLENNVLFEGLTQPAPVACMGGGGGGCGCGGRG